MAGLCRALREPTSTRAAHKIGNGITVDRIAPANLVAPLVVISIAGKARRNPFVRC